MVPHTSVLKNLNVPGTYPRRTHDMTCGDKLTHESVDGNGVQTLQIFSSKFHTNTQPFSSPKEIKTRKQCL